MLQIYPSYYQGNWTIKIWMSSIFNFLLDIHMAVRNIHPLLLETTHNTANLIDVFVRRRIHLIDPYDNKEKRPPIIY